MPAPFSSLEQSSDSRSRRAQVTTWEFPVEGGLVLARPDIQGLFILNRSACLIWQLLSSDHRVDVIVSRISSEFGISRDLADHDVRLILREWSSGLLAPTTNRTQHRTKETPDLLASTWKFTQDYRLNGRRFRLLLQAEDLVREIAPRLQALQSSPGCPDFCLYLTSEPNGFGIFRDGKRIGFEPTAPAARAILLQEIVHVSHGEPDWLTVLHAGAYGTPSHCILLAAASHAGKSTLAAALMHSGLSLFSDDSAPIERHTGKVAAMPFALMLREGSWPVLQSRFPDLLNSPVISRYGQQVRFLPAFCERTASRADVKNLVFIEFDPEAATTLSRVGAFERILFLQESGFWIPHDRASIAAFLAWVQSLPCYQLTYSNLNEAVDTIRELIDVNA